jgi:CIC family chloride channel protein
MGLGLVSGVVAVFLMRSIFLADTVASGIQDHLTLPRWLRPAVAGVLLGLIATQFPVIIGVGYETTFAALSGNLILSQAILFCMIKVVAVSITMGGRMGGGVFSPSLMVGALLGLSYGIIANVFCTVNVRASFPLCPRGHGRGCRRCVGCADFHHIDRV